MVSFNPYDSSFGDYDGFEKHRFEDYNLNEPDKNYNPFDNNIPENFNPDDSLKGNGYEEMWDMGTKELGMDLGMIELKNNVFKNKMKKPK